MHTDGKNTGLVPFTKPQARRLIREVLIPHGTDSDTLLHELRPVPLGTVEILLWAGTHVGAVAYVVHRRVLRPRRDGHCISIRVECRDDRKLEDHCIRRGAIGCSTADRVRCWP